MPFRNMSTDEIRSVVRHQVETLERWLRRMIDDALRAHYGGSLATLPIKQDIKKKAIGRRSDEPQRYPREVDALLFDDLITIVCHPQLYGPHFQDSLRDAFPDGSNEARTFLKRIVEARNPVSHANDITHHQALRVVCYAADVIDSLKAHYTRRNLAQTYNAPSFLRIWDDRGNSAEPNATTAAYYDEFRQTKLRPGDTLQLEVQPDESFPDDSYQIEWSVQMASGERCSGRVLALTIEDRHVSQDGLPIEVKIISKLNWHKHGAYDAKILVLYSVLPPV
jgi:hypothetical protein